MDMNTFGGYFRTLRLDQQLSLRDFCSAIRIDAGNLSKLERGLLPAPADDDTIEKYAKALGLVEGTEGWQKFFDLAAADRGRLPKDIMDNRELMNKLPVLCRTIASKPLSPEKIDDLIELIRRS